MNFYCPCCDAVYTGQGDEESDPHFVASCPLCGHQRTDGFNQVAPYEVSCPTCGLRKGVDVHDNSTIACINQYYHAMRLGNNPVFPQLYKRAA